MEGLVEPTNDNDLGVAVATVAGTAEVWGRLPVAEKVALLEDIQARVGAVADEWVATALSIKGIDPTSPLAGEEWISGPYAVLGWLAAAAETLRAVDEGRSVLNGLEVRTHGDQTAVRVYPTTLIESLLLHGYQAEVWMEPGLTSSDVEERAAATHRSPAQPGRVAAILGAGNITAIAALDVLCKLFVDGEVAVLKMNPVNEALGPVLERALEPLVAGRYLRFVYGGAEVGERLVFHPGVDTVHITGSARSHDAIVFGADDDAVDRRARGEPRLDKPITSELGGVTPTIVVPGPWRRSDFRFQAEHLATQKLHNNGFNCIASQVLVLPEGWDGSDRLMDELRTAMDGAPGRPSYYPGSEQRRAAIAERHDDHEALGPDGTRILLPEVDADGSDRSFFQEEYFAPVYAVTRLADDDPAGFLRRACEFVDAEVAGTLGVNLIVHPRTMRDLGPVLDEAVAGLRYGTVAVNAWTAMGFQLARAAWGAFPGHTLDDIQSGRGFVHNALMLDRPQKTVIHGPFRPFPRSLLGGRPTMSPRPPWFVTNRTAHVTGERLTRYAVDGRLRHLPGVFASALRG